MLSFINSVLGPLNCIAPVRSSMPSFARFNLFGRVVRGSMDATAELGMTPFVNTTRPLGSPRVTSLLTGPKVPIYTGKWSDILGAYGRLTNTLTFQTFNELFRSAVPCDPRNQHRRDENRADKTEVDLIQRAPPCP